MLRISALAIAAQTAFAVPQLQTSSCSQNTLQLCDTAFTSICQKFAPLCDGSIDCLLEIEGLYQDALATIDETEQCECQQISCQDWTNIQAPQGTPELTPAQEKELAVYEAAARQYMKFQDPAAMETAIQSGGLEGENGDHLLLLLLIVHKNNQNGLIKFIILKKIGLFDNPNTSGIVKFIVLKKLFGDSDTLLKLFILERITDNNNNNGV